MKFYIWVFAAFGEGFNMPYKALSKAFTRVDSRGLGLAWIYINHSRKLSGIDSGLGFLSSSTTRLKKVQAF